MSLGVTRSKFIRNLRNVVFGGTALSVIAFNALSHSEYLHARRKWFQLYESKGKSKYVNDDLVLTCVAALEDTKIVKTKKMRTKFFHSIGTDVIAAGSYDMKGVVIGIPYNFTYKSVSDINKDDIRIAVGKKINWDSEHGKQLLESLVLSEDAKKFAISRAMYFSNNKRIVVHSVYAGFSCTIPIAISDLLEKLPANPVKRISTLVFYAITIPFAALQYYFIEGLLFNHYDGEADKAAASLNQKYKQGAIEYYEKKILFNKAWKILAESDSDQAITDDGDVKGWKYRRSLKEKLKIIETVVPKRNHVDSSEQNNDVNNVPDVDAM